MAVVNRNDALKPNMLQSAAHFMPNFMARVPNDTTLERILTPAYWCNHWSAFVDRQTKAPILGGMIHVMREDMSLDVVLRVIGVGPGYVQVRELFPAFVNDTSLERRAAVAASDAAPDMPLLPDGYKDYHVTRGTTPGYGIRLTATGDNIVVGKPSKREAILAAREHYKLAHNGEEPPAPAAVEPAAA